MQWEGRRQEVENCQGRDASQSISFSLAASAFFCNTLCSFISCRSEARSKPCILRPFELVDFSQGPRSPMTTSWKSFHYHLISAPSHSAVSDPRFFSSNALCETPGVECMPGRYSNYTHVAHFYFVSVEFTACCLYRIVGELSTWFILKVARFQGKITFTVPANFG